MATFTCLSITAEENKQKELQETDQQMLTTCITSECKQIKITITGYIYKPVLETASWENYTSDRNS